MAFQRCVPAEELVKWALTSENVHSDVDPATIQSLCIHAVYGKWPKNSNTSFYTILA